MVNLGGPLGRSLRRRGHLGKDKPGKDKHRKSGSGKDDQGKDKDEDK